MRSTPSAVLTHPFPSSPSLTSTSACLEPIALSSSIDWTHSAEIVRSVVPMLVPRGQSGVVLHIGSCMGLLPLISMESGANKVLLLHSLAFCHSPPTIHLLGLTSSLLRFVPPALGPAT